MTTTRQYQLPSSDPYDETLHACTVSAADADIMNLYKWRVDSVSGRVVAGSDRALVQLAWLVCAREHGPRPETLWTTIMAMSRTTREPICTTARPAPTT